MHHQSHLHQQQVLHQPHLLQQCPPQLSQPQQQHLGANRGSSNSQQWQCSQRQRQQLGASSWSANSQRGQLQQPKLGAASGSASSHVHWRKLQQQKLLQRQHHCQKLMHQSIAGHDLGEGGIKKPVQLFSDRNF